jgi:proline iminopeptidase
MKLATRRAGDGPALICHPGGPGFSSHEFTEDLGGLARTRELVLVDARGTGDSPRPGDPSEYRTSDYVADLEELRAELALETIDLLGFSHGGIVAMAYAAMYPAHVRKLVLASTIAAITAETKDEMERLKAARQDEPWYQTAEAALAREEQGDYDDETFAQLWRDMAPMYFSRWDDRYQSWLDGSDTGVTAAPLRVFNAEFGESFDLRPELPRITAPALVLTGRDDFICGPAAAAQIAERIPDAEVVLLEGAGHMTFLEQPEAFAAAVERFLAA